MDRIYIERQPSGAEDLPRFGKFSVSPPKALGEFKKRSFYVREDGKDYILFRKDEGSEPVVERVSKERGENGLRERLLDLVGAYVLEIQDNALGNGLGEFRFKNKLQYYDMREAIRRVLGREQDWERRRKLMELNGFREIR